MRRKRGLGCGCFTLIVLAVAALVVFSQGNGAVKQVRPPSGVNALFAQATAVPPPKYANTYPPGSEVTFLARWPLLPSQGHCVFVELENTYPYDVLQTILSTPKGQQDLAGVVQATVTSICR